jgi:hypothetical protein
MTDAATIEALAGELAEVLLRGDPFWASFMAIGGYDDAVSDLSPEYRQEWRDRLVGQACHDRKAAEAAQEIACEPFRTCSASPTCAGSNSVAAEVAALYSNTRLHMG